MYGKEIIRERENSPTEYISTLNSIQKIKQNDNKYEERLNEFSKNFDGNGAENTAKIVSEVLERKK